MPIEIWKVGVSLGVPGLALIVFYMLMKKFQWDFPKVPRRWVGPIVVLFILTVGGIVVFAIARFAPDTRKAPADSAKFDKSRAKEKELNITRSCLLGFDIGFALHKRLIGHETQALKNIASTNSFQQALGIKPLVPHPGKYATRERLLDAYHKYGITILGHLKSRGEAPAAAFLLGWAGLLKKGGSAAFQDQDLRSLADKAGFQTVSSDNDDQLVERVYKECNARL